MKPIDFLAIGDIVIDAFIKLKDASVHCGINHENCEICMPFAEKIPYESVTIVTAVGNGPNAAASAARLGLSAGIMTDVGNDQHGKDCINTIKESGVSSKFVSVHRHKKTNYHYVLWFEDERTILVKHEAFPYKFSAPFRNPRWVYITSLGGDSLAYQQQIIAWLEKNPDIKVAFQPGTFQMNVGYEKLLGFYKRSEVFFCNVEEAKRILKNTTAVTSGAPAAADGIKELLRGIHALGPKIVVITDGPRGAYAFNSESGAHAGQNDPATGQGEFWFMPPYPDPKPPVERTGAGDAFASTFTVALALGKTIPEALMWGPINSMAVVQDIGAQRGLLSRHALEEFLKHAPESYKPRKI